MFDLVVKRVNLLCGPPP